MKEQHHIKLITDFPDFKENGFDIEQYNQLFRQSNVIIKAKSRHISYPEHWGPLSVKFCPSGKENYKIGKRFYSVDSSNYLILNDGQHYSSYIYSEIPVESFTLNFTPKLLNSVYTALSKSDSINIDNPFDKTNGAFTFTEKLTKKNSRLIYLTDKLFELSNQFQQEKRAIEELLLLLLEQLVIIEDSLCIDKAKVDMLKASTKNELYKRLHYAKDYIDSCYQNDITLSDLAEVANLNSAYLLRRFKNLFSLTPYQYLIKKRISVAGDLLAKNHYTISEVCHEVGYADLTSFGKLFKKIYHLSPESFQKALQNKKQVYIE